ncbi:TPA: hypothetical protein RQO57_003589 [Aeromonas dhakensis]|uniref:hypothetical protein n=1 Tax=Aeromonas dhakensis TaxID=196024 RepID=UPI00288CA109|nr:hypothetical protein [Aeromonas dhakensis]
MTYSVIINGKTAFISEVESGRYQSKSNAITAVMSAAKDIDITSININNTVYSTIDSFTGGLLNTSRIVEIITGEEIADEPLIGRFKKSLISILSTCIAGFKFDSNDATQSFDGSHNPPYKKKEISIASPLNYKMFSSRWDRFK